MAREATFDAHEFDAQCDLAALVFGKPDEPDRLLQEFVQGLVSRGCRVVGLIQTRLADGGAAVRVLPTGETIPLAPRLDALASSPRSSSSPLGACDLAEAAARIDALILSGADLVVVNRFGKLEAQGAGLVEEIARALKFDIPVLVAVSELRFSEWLAFCRGMGVKLPCRNESLQSWWNGMIASDRLPVSRRHVSVCELSK